MFVGRKERKEGQVEGRRQGSLLPGVVMVVWRSRRSYVPSEVVRGPCLGWGKKAKLDMYTYSKFIRHMGLRA